MFRDNDAIAHAAMAWGSLVLVFFILAVGLTKCSEQEHRTRTACANTGGIVVFKGANDSDCVRNTKQEK